MVYPIYPALINYPQFWSTYPEPCWTRNQALPMSAALRVLHSARIVFICFTCRLGCCRWVRLQLRVTSTVLDGHAGVLDWVH